MLLLPAEGNLEIELESRELPAMLLCMLKCPLSPAARNLEIEYESRESASLNLNMNLSVTYITKTMYM